MNCLRKEKVLNNSLLVTWKRKESLLKIKMDFTFLKNIPKRETQRKVNFFLFPFISLVRQRMRGYEVTEDPKVAEVIKQR